MEGYTKIKNVLITSSQLDELEYRILSYMLSIEKDNLCYPSIRKMAEIFNKSTTTITKYLKSLEAKSFILKENRELGTGKKTSNKYLINEDAISKNLKKNPVVNETREPSEEELKIIDYNWIDEGVL